MSSRGVRGFAVVDGLHRFSQILGCRVGPSRAGLSERSAEGNAGAARSRRTPRNYRRHRLRILTSLATELRSGDAAGGTGMKEPAGLPAAFTTFRSALL